MKLTDVFHELWIYLKILVQVFGIGLFIDNEDAMTSPLQLRSEWPGDSIHWVASLNCPIYLPVNYTPEDDQKGFYIYLILDDHASGIDSVFYPFDRNSVVMEKVDGKKEFLIKTSSDVWEYKGQKNYEIHVAFTNKNKHEKGNWPRGTCSGPYDLE